MIDVAEAFERYSDEYLKFDRITHPLSKRPDVHAFLLLDNLVPGIHDIVSSSEHDEFFLSIDVDELAGVAIDDDIRDLRRCGVRYNREFGCLCMFT